MRHYFKFSRDADIYKAQQEVKTGYFHVTLYDDAKMEYYVFKTGLLV
jgi:hypothetical protein